MKRLLSIILVLVLICGLLPLDCFAATAYAGGAGTESDPFLIGTAEQLALLAQQVNNGTNYAGQYFKLTDDIDLIGMEWTPIGGSSTTVTGDLNEITFANYRPFSGTFDGDGHTISNITFFSGYNKNYAGLFGFSNGTIKNLSVSYGDITLKSTNSNVEARYFGGIVAMQHSGEISNCRFTGNVDTGDFSFGGIAGQCYSTTITDCITQGSFTQAKSKITSTLYAYLYYNGGIAGLCFYGRIENCMNYAHMTVNAKYTVTGGIAGGSPSQCINCVNFADITAKYDMAGGIMAATRISTTRLEGCINYGNITANDSDAGGIAAEAAYASSISRCSNYGDIWAQDCAGGIAADCFPGNSSISQSLNCGNVYSSSWCAGGITAYGNTYAQIRDCYNTGSISSNDVYSSARSGGIGGFGVKSIDRCYNVGAVSAKSKRVGGIICETKVVGSNNYFLDNVAKGNYETAELVTKKLTDVQMQYAESFEGFDFEKVWDISPFVNNGYPYLRNNPPKYSVNRLYLEFSNTGLAPEYPVVNEQAFVKQLESWLQGGAYSAAFNASGTDLTYEEILDMTIDLPAMADDGTGYSIQGTATVRDAIAYIAFANNVQHHMDNVLREVRSLVASGKHEQAYTAFLKEVENFNTQYLHFQQELNNKNTFNQTLRSLLLIQTALAVSEVFELTLSNGEKTTVFFRENGVDPDKLVTVHSEKVTSAIKLKSSCNYITKLYKTNVDLTQSADHYDDLWYYIASGGDTQFLNPVYEDALDDYALLIKDAKKLYSVIKTDAEDLELSSFVGIGLDNIAYFSDHFDSPYSSLVGDIRKGWSRSNTALDVIKAVDTGSMFGLMGAAWELADTYINEVKKVYEDARSVDAGWYALTYYYLALNNPRLLDSIIDPNTGDVSFLRLVNGWPVDHSDAVQNSLTSYYTAKQKYMDSLYEPDTAFRMHVWSSCNTMANIQSINCTEYRDMLLRYIVAELSLASEEAGLTMNIQADTSNASLGTVSGAGAYRFGSTACLAAHPGTNVTFTGWKDTFTGQIVSTDAEYTFTVYNDMALQAQFAAGNFAVAQKPRILACSDNTAYYAGETAAPLSVTCETTDGGMIQVDWYRNTRISTVGSTYVGSGPELVPDTSTMGTYYYYAVVTNALTSSVGTDTRTSHTSTVTEMIAVDITDPILTGISLASLPKQMTYLLNGSLRTGGMVLKANYSDGTAETVTGYSLDYDFSEIGTKTVTVSYWGMEDQFDVEVVDKLTGQLSDTVFWELDSATNTLTIRGTGAVPGFVSDAFYTDASRVRTVDISEGISSLGEYALYGLRRVTQVTLPKTLSSIGRCAFNYCNALTDVYYHADEGSWQKIVISEGNDPLINATIHYTDIIKPTLQLVSPSLNFEDVIYYNVYYTVSDMTDVVEMGMITFNESNENGTVDDADAVIPGHVSGGELFMVHSNGIPAKDLGDVLYFKVYAKLSDGSYAYSAQAGYHAVAYAKEILAGFNDVDMKALVVSMLNYGAAAQVNFGYKTDELMNSFLTADQQALMDSYRPDMVAPVVAVDKAKVGQFDRVAGGYSALTPSVSFEGAFSVHYYFTPAKEMDNGLTMYYWSAADYAAADVLTPENATGTFEMIQGGLLFTATVDGIAAKQIDETIYVAGIYESDGVSYPTGVIAYSLATYCLGHATNGGTTMKPLAQATIVYGYYAKAYFTKKSAIS